MRTLVESFRRLFLQNKISLVALQERKTSGLLTEQEFLYITDSDKE